MTNVVVFVPGIMGSILKHAGVTIWPPPASSLLFKYPYMNELASDDVVVGDIVRNISIMDQYESLMSYFERCGFIERPKTHHPQTLYAFPYDWRKDIAVAAEGLAALISSIHETHGDVSISIVGHSMGGLVARCYLESGSFVARAGFATVRMLVTLGTPHLGAPMALPMVMGERKQVVLSKEQVKALANDSRFPAVYQLLPPKGAPFAYDMTARARALPVDIYSEEHVAGLGLSLENMAAASAFHARLSTARRPPAVRYFSFVGTRQSTATAVGVTASGAGMRIRVDEAEDGGDGSVPAWSGAVGGFESRPVGGAHHVIFRARELRATLSVLLGHDGVLGPGDSPAWQLAVRDRFVSPSGPVHAAISPDTGIDAFEGDLVVTLIDPDTGTPASAGSSQPISYTGTSLESLGVRFSAPEKQGLYRVQLRSRGQTDAIVAEDDIVVQREMKAPE